MLAVRKPFVPAPGGFHMHRSTRASGVLLAVATLLALSGCAGTRRENFQRDQAAAHVYRKPLVELWPQVKAVLQEKGYSWRESSGRFVLETEWRDAGDGTLGTATSYRYLVEGYTRPSGGTILRVMRAERTSQDIGSNYRSGVVRTRSDMAGAVASSNTSGKLPAERRSARDLQLELELLQRLDPEAAAKLEADAKSAHP
jgi:hypothetical protein